MLKKVLILVLLGLFLFALSGCNDIFTGDSLTSLMSDDTEADESKSDEDAEEDEIDLFDQEGAPIGVDREIHEEIDSRINSAENPGRRNTPAEFIYPERDPAYYEAWVNETYELGVAFQDRVYNETAAKYGKTSDEVRDIFKEVSTWIFENDLDTGH